MIDIDTQIGKTEQQIIVQDEDGHTDKGICTTRMSALIYTPNDLPHTVPAKSHRHAMQTILRSTTDNTPRFREETVTRQVRLTIPSLQHTTHRKTQPTRPSNMAIRPSWRRTLPIGTKLESSQPTGRHTGNSHNLL
jgi:hypothetical protein